jgi:hypothetical protein
MSSLLGDISWPLSWLFDFWSWLTSPSVVPWLGMLAAVGAGLTIRSRDWLTSPKTLILRSFQVAIVWLILVFLLGLLVPGTPGQSDGKGKGSTGDESAKGDDNAEQEASVSVKTVPASAGGQSFDLTVKFVPSKANASIAVDFACDLFFSGGEATQVEIRAGDMENFQRLLVERLHDLKPTSRKRPVTVYVEKSPSPGESVLRSVTDKIRAVVGNCEVSIGDSPK